MSLGQVLVELNWGDEYKFQIVVCIKALQMG
jgi:hypothetical protein